MRSIVIHTSTVTCPHVVLTLQFEQKIHESKSVAGRKISQ